MTSWNEANGVSSDFVVHMWSNGPNCQEVHDPSLAEIEGWVDSFDGASVDEGGMWLERQGTPIGMMLIAGGNEGRLILHWEWYGPDDWSNDVIMLVDRSQGNRLFANVEGGQRTELPGRFSVARAVALRAVKRFAFTHQLDDGLGWDFVPAVPGLPFELTRAEVQGVSEQIVRKLL
jgi:hypothetical protein